MKKIKIYEMEFITCPRAGIILLDSDCVRCEYHEGWYSGTGHVGCEYDE